MPNIDKLKNAIDAFEHTSYGAQHTGSELSRQRSLALDAYQGINIEPAPEGRSQVQDRSVFETIQWILPSLMRIFAGNSRVVEFDPVGPDDEDAAEQESEHLDFLIKQKTDWDLICRQWFTDAMLTKNAYCHVYMDEVMKVEHEIYEGLTDAQVAALTEDGLEVVAAEAREDEEQQVPVMDEMGQPVIDPMTGQPLTQPMVTYDVEVRETKAKKQLKFQVIPPENCRVAESTPDFTLRECPYFEYWEWQTISDLRQMGYDVPDDIADGGEPFADTMEDSARDNTLAVDSLNDDNRVDPAMKQVKVRCIWIRHDYDEDGIAEMQKVTRVGDEILDIEPCSRIPVASIVPFINTHRHVGMSVADLVFDIQRIKTALLRAGLDAMYLANNPRHALSKKVHVDDYLTSRPGAAVRIDTDNPDVQGHIMPLQTENTFPIAQAGLEHMDRVIESRVGVNRMFQGIDESSLNDHNRIGQLSTMAAQRVEDIARVFSQGVRDLFGIAHEIVLKSGHQKETVKLRGQWIDIDPNQWNTGRDMRICAPFAAGNKDALAQRVMVHLNIHQQALTQGAPFVQADDTYRLLKILSEATDLPAENIYTDPRTVQPPPPPPDYTAAALEIENKKADNEAMDEQRRSELDKYKADLNARLEEYKVRADAELKLALKQLDVTGKVDIEGVKAQLQAAKEMPEPKERTDPAVDALVKANERTTKAFEKTMTELTKIVKETTGEKEIVRDENGRPTGVRTKR